MKSKYEKNDDQCAVVVSGSFWSLKKEPLSRKSLAREATGTTN